MKPKKVKTMKTIIREETGYDLTDTRCYEVLEERIKSLEFIINDTLVNTYRNIEELKDLKNVKYMFQCYCPLKDRLLLKNSGTFLFLIGSTGKKDVKVCNSELNEIYNLDYTETEEEVKYYAYRDPCHGLIRK